MPRSRWLSISKTTRILKPSGTSFTICQSTQHYHHTGHFRFQSHSMRAMEASNHFLTEDWIFLPKSMNNSFITSALSLVRELKRTLNAFALNKWRLVAPGKWHWPSEISVVTGGCGGIGKELVLKLRARGVRVAILDLLPLPGDFEDDSSILFIKTDITSPEQVAEAAQTIRDTFGHPSILINNAGLGAPHSILDTPPGYLSKMFGAAALTFHEGVNSELKVKYKADGVITTIIQRSWVRTPMSPDNADEIEHKQGKMLRPEAVAEAALEYIWSCKGGHVILPNSLSFFSTLKGWPNWAQELMRDAMGRSSLL
ncbi:hypothetical protein B0T11DRAFT_292501 [Plectosphaerella cucumerina]|uniref:Uncharacterized protein n=1 Tax=Plectosphaerella cucumerina TaxID=40658 RepID=A0A8K0X7W1_9PEZI|nr:hypothetical protein B0T11DRAFT_292501 [Plectosphaerella cucumerina]